MCAILCVSPCPRPCPCPRGLPLPLPLPLWPVPLPAPAPLPAPVPALSLLLQEEDVVRLLHSLSCAKYQILSKEPAGRSISKNDKFK